MFSYKFVVVEMTDFYQTSSYITFGYSSFDDWSGEWTTLRSYGWLVTVGDNGTKSTPFPSWGYLGEVTVGHKEWRYKGIDGFTGFDELASLCNIVVKMKVKNFHLNLQ